MNVRSVETMVLLLVDKYEKEREKAVIRAGTAS